MVYDFHYYFLSDTYLLSFSSFDIKNVSFNSQKSDLSEYEKNLFIRKVYHIQQRAEVTGYLFSYTLYNSHRNIKNNILESGKDLFQAGHPSLHSTHIRMENWSDTEVERFQAYPVSCKTKAVINCKENKSNSARVLQKFNSHTNLLNMQ